MEDLVASTKDIKLTVSAPRLRPSLHVDDDCNSVSNQRELIVSDLRRQSIRLVIPDKESRKWNEAAQCENDEDDSSPLRCHESFLDGHPHAHNSQEKDPADKDVAPNDERTTGILE